MQIAIVLFDRFTALDAVGPYQVLGSLPGAEVVFAAERPGRIGDDAGCLYLSADAALADVPHPDIVVVPGGQVQASFVVADPAGLLGGEDHLGAGQVGEHRVGADRVQRGEPVIEHDGDLHDSPSGRDGSDGGTRLG